MITDADIVKLKAVFATKEDLLGMEKRFDDKFATKDDLVSMEKRQDSKYAIKDDIILIKKGIRKIQKTLNTSITLSENQFKYHHIRLTNIEEKVGIKKPDYFPISP